MGTVALSLGASFGLSVLIWQDIFGIQLYWIVLALAVILLLAVGSDYNLLLISRFKEEIDAGLNTGIIRAMAGSGSVVTAAGLVFAATMASFVFADLRILGQIGTTIALGPAVRHADRAVVHDAVDRGAARALVLVAAAGSHPAREPHASARTDHAHRVGQLLLWDGRARPRVGGRSRPATRRRRALWRCSVVRDGDVCKCFLHPGDPAQLSRDVHRRKHGNAADERPERRVAAVEWSSKRQPTT